MRIRIGSGELLCRRLDGVVAARGIPYAAPPVGALRWRPPLPVPSWPEARFAYDPGPAPVQPQPDRASVMWHTNFADRGALVMSEDCLYLNVWTPDPFEGARLPVMVFLHGGAHRFGHGGQEIHDGAALARRGVVVVTVNMRLGALGFLAHPELAEEDELGASGNYGLLDVVAALEWVRREITAFGGDPAKVTLAGNSAGAAIVTHLMAAPAARGLFRAAIGQSSSGIFRAEGPMLDQREAQRAGLAAVGDASLAGLRRLPATSLLLDAHLGVVVDGRLITRDTREVFVAGRQAPIPLLVGTTADEGAVYAHGAPAVPPALADCYPEGSARLYVGETRFVYPVWRWARAHVATAGAPTWMYRFDVAPPLPPGIDLLPPPDGLPGYGAYHTSELPYTGDNLHVRDWPWRPSDRELARVMADAWARFVATGDPNGPGLPQWPRFDAGPDARVIVFGDPVRSAPMPRADALGLLDAVNSPGRAPRW
ncbi:carboxylesterase family protein [Actinoplanes sp. NPDC051851]|uniref:carboxylesterase/lipase family protein n=1 Tax=Actinoplanes sp. NPDC051851 TaxID=3154753 RepID=UPI00341BBFC7